MIQFLYFVMAVIVTAKVALMYREHTKEEFGAASCDDGMDWMMYMLVGCAAGLFWPITTPLILFTLMLRNFARSSDKRKSNS